jgi:nitroreductase
MSTLTELISRRRSAALFDEDAAPDAATLHALLELAIQAPNHHLTFPWRFHVVAKDDRDRLGALWAAEAVDRGWVPETSRKFEQAKLGRAPLIIFVGVVSDPNDPIRFREDQAAVAATVAQLLLLFEDAGFSALWRTGRMVESEAIPAALSYQPGETTAAILYVGRRRATHVPPPRRRPPVERVVSWGLNPPPLTSPTAKELAGSPG